MPNDEQTFRFGGPMSGSFTYTGAIDFTCWVCREHDCVISYPCCDAAERREMNPGDSLDLETFEVEGAN